MRRALFIGRFQPFHNGHLHAVKKIREECDELIIGVGGAQHSHRKDDPFTYDEREMMIKLALQETGIKASIKAIPDINDYPNYVKHVRSCVGDYDILYTGNPIVRDLFEQQGIEVREFKNRTNESATQVRERMSKEENWQELVPKGTADVLTTIKGANRVKTINAKWPRPAGDCIIELHSPTGEFKGIILIERKHPPLGYGFPGGMQDYGESLENTAIREAKEETGLDVQLVKQLGTYSDPDRDPRYHINSTVFIAKAKGDPRAGDDAKAIKVVSREELASAQLVADHGKIAKDYLNTLSRTNES